MKLGALYAGESCLLPRVWKAVDSWDRMRGLLGRPPLQPGEGLWIEPCASVHTFGMGYPLDLAFVDGQGRVKKLVHALSPLRLSGAVGARATLEAAAGQLAAFHLSVGDQLVWREQSA